MKKLIWFDIGVPIPNDAKYIKSAERIVAHEDDWDPFNGNYKTAVRREQHLYEVTESSLYQFADVAEGSPKEGL